MKIRIAIEEIADKLLDSVKEVHDSDIPAREKASIELMALNAMCNAEKALKSECHCESGTR
ncbi:MAG: hypothetical protein NC548_56840 [Lachnospiraceae bacterium]|nr:hypothetical protein [Lachnospiraceae bacterium]